ncbi:MAG: hypothetical protein CL678_14950 [Bdellovibrionaceae bacterium]|nr:hypothetical protein [Pseudobdellovibrionaceae bacterium]|tara:strand:+ start:7511 stop:8272 length:762 start_codon:yes stop_codon:yes gene_type:complete
MKKKSSLLLGVVLLFQTSSARSAVFTFDTSLLNGLTQDSVDSLIGFLALGGDHRSMRPASSLGGFPGFELGVSVVGLNLPTNFSTALALLGGTSTASSILPLPKLYIAKGLGFGIDLGFSYFSLSSLGSFYGLDVQWAFIEGKGPSVAARYSLSYSTLSIFQARSHAIDVVASYPLFLIEPYVGAGFIYASGEVGFDSGELPVNLSASSTFAVPRFFAGLPLQLGFFHITFETMFGFSSNAPTTYGLKAALNF